MTNLPQVIAGSGKINTKINELGLRSNTISPNGVPAMLVSTTTRGAFLTPKRTARAVVSQGTGTSSARWL